MTLSIRGAGTCHLIYLGSAIVAGPYTSDGNATAALRGVERRLQPVIKRRCMACLKPFASRAARLCRACNEGA